MTETQRWILILSVAAIAVSMGTAVVLGVMWIMVRGAFEPVKAPRQWLVPNARDFYKWASTWVFALIGVAAWCRENIDWIQNEIPATWYHYLVIALSAIGVLSRVIQQKQPAPPPQSPEKQP